MPFNGSIRIIWSISSNLILDSMGLGNTESVQTSKHYISISNGKVIIDRGKGKKESFNYVEGILEGIYTQKRIFGGEEVVRWFIDLRDGTDIYSICLPYSSGVFKSIVLALASDENLNSTMPIRIEPYEMKGYTKVKVYAEGVKMDWINEDMPPVEEIVIGDKKIKDDRKRMEFISKLCNTINERIARN